MKQRTGADVGGPGKSRPVPRARLRTAWALGLLLALCLAAYANVWRGEFVADDMTLRQHVASQSRAGGWFDLFRHDLYHSENGVRSGFYRPLAALSLLVDGAVYARPAGYHATNVFLHVVATWLVLGLGLAFGLPAPVALGAAALFAALPAHGEAVAWISGRFDVLCAALYLLALWLFTLAHRRRSWRLYAAALLAGAGALLSKEMAATLPAAVLICDLLGLSRERRPSRVSVGGFWADDWRGAVRRAVPVAIFVLAYVALRMSRPELALGRSGEATAPFAERLLTAGRALFFYLGVLLWPGPPNILSLVPPITRPSDPWFLAAVLLGAGCVWVAVRWRRSRPELSFGIAFLLLSLAPLANLVAFYPAQGLRFPVAERYMYLPSFGFTLVLALLLWECAGRLGTRQRVAFTTAVLLLAGAGIARCLTRNPVWQTNDALYESSLRADPKSPWAHIMLGVLRRSQGRPEEARQSFATALQLDPRNYAARFELGNVEMSLRRYDAAAEWYRRALEVAPQSHDGRIGLGNALLQMGKLEEADHEYAILLALRPDDPEALVNQGQVLALQGNMDAARQRFERAVHADPNRKEAHYNLALDAARRHDSDLAERHARAMLAIDPSAREGWMLLGNLRVGRGDFKGAAHEFERALAADSTYTRALVNLGATYLNLGDYPRAITVLQKALRREPSAMVYVNLAEAQQRSGDPAAAERSFREAVRLDPGMTVARRDLGLMLASQPGRGVEARALLDSLPANPAGADAQVESTLARLRGK